MRLTLLFTSSSDWSSKIIRFFTRSKTSHVMIGLQLFGVEMLLHCTGGGVQFTPRRKWMRDNYMVGEFTCTVDLTYGLSHAVRHLGEKYDYLSLIGFLPILFFRWLKIKVKNPLASPKAMVCSEFVLHVDPEGKVPEWSGMDPETTTAQDLLELCEEGKSFEAILEMK